MELNGSSKASNRRHAENFLHDEHRREHALQTDGTMEKKVKKYITGKIPKKILQSAQGTGYWTGSTHLAVA